MYAATVGLRLFPWTGRVQPYAAAAAGLLVGDRDTASGKSDTDQSAMGRFGGGVDFYLTERVVFEVEAVYVVPFDELDDYPHALFGGGLQYRF